MSTWPIMLDDTAYSAKAAMALFGVSRFVMEQAMRLQSPSTVGGMKDAIRAYLAIPIRRKMTHASRLWNNGGQRPKEPPSKAANNLRK